MEIDPNEALVGMDEKPDSESRKIQTMGRVDVPNDMWNFLGLEHEDTVLVRINEDKECVEIHSQSKVESRLG
jgi:hypothetical protein